MPTDTDIANMALSRLGTRATIADLTENSTEARQVNLWYATERDELQSLVDWNFNRRLAGPRRRRDSAGTLGFQLRLSVRLPQDAAAGFRRRGLGPAARRRPVSRSPPMAAARSSTATRIRSPRSTPQRVTDAARFTPGFILAFVDCLAASVAHAITQKADLAERLARRAQDRIERAMADSANEGLMPDDVGRLAQSLTVRGFDGSTP
jgi:hypothetical protein